MVTQDRFHPGLRHRTQHANHNRKPGQPGQLGVDRCQRRREHRAGDAQQHIGGNPESHPHSTPDARSSTGTWRLRSPFFEVTMQAIYKLATAESHDYLIEGEYYYFLSVNESDVESYLKDSWQLKTGVKNEVQKQEVRQETVQKVKKSK
jgi:hypothetical protein